MHILHEKVEDKLHENFQERLCDWRIAKEVASTFKKYIVRNSQAKLSQKKLGNDLK